MLAVSWRSREIPTNPTLAILRVEAITMIAWVVPLSEYVLWRECVPRGREETLDACCVLCTIGVATRGIYSIWKHTRVDVHQFCF